MRILILILTILCFYAQVFSETNCNYELKEFSIHKDETGNLTITDVISSEIFTSANNLNFSYTNAAYWIRFAAKEKCDEQKNYLVSQYRCLDYVDIYLVRNGEVLKSLSTGYLKPLETREKKITRFAFSLPDDVAVTDSIYLRIQKHEGTLRTELFFENEETVLEKNHTERQIIFFYLGVSFIMLVFALTYFVSFRLNMFLWYMLFVFSAVMHQLTNFGYGNIYLWGDWFWFANISRTIWNAPFVFAMLMFTYDLLQVKQFCSEKLVRIFNVLKILVALPFFIALLPLPAYPWRFSVFIFHILLYIIILILVVYATLRAVKNKHVPGYFFLFGELFLLVMVLIMALRNFNIIPADPLPQYLHIYIGIAAMSLTLFSMVAYTRQMHIKVIKELVPVAIKPEPKELSETELEKLNTIFTQIEVFISEHKSYLNTELSLKTLSEESEIAEHLLSKAINIKANMHFFDYINSYRIKEACRLLADKEVNKLYSIEGLAMQCGFKNKTSFNKAFKKFTGKTPSEFRVGLA